MTTQLFNQEMTIKEVQISNDKYIITDKRLIYESQTEPNKSAYIAINQLSKATVSTVQIKVDKITKSQIQLYSFLITVFSVIGLMAYMNSQTHMSFQEYGIIAMMFIGVIILAIVGTISTVILGIIFSLINASISNAEQKVQLRIDRVDGGNFANMFYDMESMVKLNEMEIVINEQIFHK